MIDLPELVQLMSEIPWRVAAPTRFGLEPIDDDLKIQGHRIVIASDEHTVRAEVDGSPLSFMRGVTKGIDAWYELHGHPELAAVTRLYLSHILDLRRAAAISGHAMIALALRE